MEEQPCSINGVSKIRRIPCKITEELGAGHIVNGRSIKEYEKAV